MKILPIKKISDGTSSISNHQYEMHCVHSVIMAAHLQLSSFEISDILCFRPWVYRPT